MNEKNEIKLNKKSLSELFIFENPFLSFVSYFLT